MDAERSADGGGGRGPSVEGVALQLDEHGGLRFGYVLDPVDGVVALVTAGEVEVVRVDADGLERWARPLTEASRIALWFQFRAACERYGEPAVVRRWLAEAQEAAKVRP